MRVSLSPEAEQDFEALFDHVQAAYSPHGALWFNELSATLASLGVFPLRGKLLEKRSGLRRILYGKRQNRYLILYRVSSEFDLVIVTAILHGHTMKAARFLTPLL